MMLVKNLNVKGLLIGLGSALAGTWIGNAAVKKTGVKQIPGKGGVAIGVGLGVIGGVISAYSDTMLGIGIESTRLQENDDE